MQFVVRRLQSVIAGELNFALGDDIARVHSFVDVVDRHSLERSLKMAPEIRVRSLVPWQITDMKINGAQPRQFEIFRPKNKTVSVADDDVRIKTLNFVDRYLARN